MIRHQLVYGKCSITLRAPWENCPLNVKEFVVKFPHNCPKCALIVVAPRVVRPEKKEES